MEQQFYLMDLHRSIRSGEMHYWKPNERGYTTNIREAGLYDESKAQKHVTDDFDRHTVMIPESVVNKIW